MCLQASRDAADNTSHCVEKSMIQKPPTFQVAWQFNYKQPQTWITQKLTFLMAEKLWSKHCFKSQSIKFCLQESLNNETP